jgi:hypothetical protein
MGTVESVFVYVHGSTGFAVQQAAADVAVGETPGVSTIDEARSAAIEGAKRVMRFQEHSMKPAVVDMLKRDIRPLMDREDEPSVNDTFQFWLAEAAAGKFPRYQPHM